LFVHFARATARFTGRPSAFILASLTVVVWAVTGPAFGFSDTWQLVINTGTTIVTFLMVFLIQNTQYRDSEAVQLKLDELIRAVKGAQNKFLDLEELTEQELDEIKKHYFALANRARHGLKEKTGKEQPPLVADDSGTHDDGEAAKLLQSKKQAR
jgi:low affinity Fe/Cu permease